MPEEYKKVVLIIADTHLCNILTNFLKFRNCTVDLADINLIDVTKEFRVLNPKVIIWDINNQDECDIYNKSPQEIKNKSLLIVAEGAEINIENNVNIKNNGNIINKPFELMQLNSVLEKFGISFY